MLLCEELLLLLLDNETGTASSRLIGRDEALAGALLLDLVEAERLVDRNGKLATTGSPPLAPALAAAFAAMGSEARTAAEWVGKLPGRVKPITGTIAESLVRSGVIDEQRHKTLGRFTSTRYPELDGAPERELRSRLRSVLLEGAEPDAQTASLLGLLVPLDVIKGLVPKDDRRAAKARAKAVADRGPVGDAIRAAVEQQVIAAVIVAGGAAASAG